MSESAGDGFVESYTYEKMDEWNVFTDMPEVR